jgi:TPR repeat protein
MTRLFLNVAGVVFLAQAVFGQALTPPGGAGARVVSTNSRPTLSSEQFAAKLAEVRTAAEKGDPVAQNRLGDLFGQGKFVTLDLAEAVKWYRKSADGGYAPAQFNLGLVYENGEGVARDRSAALKWYRKAAKNGHVPAEFNLGLLLLKGEGGSKDISQGAQWVKKAAEHDDHLAQVALAGLYLNGEGFPVDKVESFAWLNLVAKNPAYKDDHVQLSYQDAQRNLTPRQMAEAESRSKVLAKEITERQEALKKTRK